LYSSLGVIIPIELPNRGQGSAATIRLAHTGAADFSNGHFLAVKPFQNDETAEWDSIETCCLCSLNMSYDYYFYFVLFNRILL
jgi:hypothetical protein